LNLNGRPGSVALIAIAKADATSLPESRRQPVNCGGKSQLL
jgi:hypothetical protein